MNGTTRHPHGTGELAGLAFEPPPPPDHEPGECDQDNQVDAEHGE